MYNPIFVSFKIGLIKILLLISLVYSVNKWKTVKRYLRDYKQVILLIMFSVVYCSVIILSNSGDAITPYTMLVWFLESTFIPIFLINSIFIKYKLSLIKTLLTISLVAAGVSIFLFLNPSINNFVLGGIIEKPIENYFDTWHRCFGIAEGLTNSYGIIQAIFASICLLKGISSPKYYLLVPILTLSVVINARTGIIPISITLLYVICKSSFFSKLVFFIFFSLVVSIVINILDEYGDSFASVTEFVSSFFVSTYDFVILGNADSDYYSVLESFIHFPNSALGIIFGEGSSMFHNRDMNTDIGYINQIYTGGIVFLSCLILIQLKIYKKIYFRYNRHFLVLLLFITAFIINFKGITFCTSEGFSRLVMLLYFTLLHNKIFPKRVII